MAHDPVLLYKFQIDRSTYLKRLRWQILIMLIVGAAFFALDLAGRSEDGESLNYQLLDIGKLVAGVVLGLLFIRAGLMLYRAFTNRPETARFFSQGFQWKRGKKVYKYSWSKLKTVRESPSAVQFLMADGVTLRFTRKHGNIHNFLKCIDEPLADVLGTRMGRLMREKSKAIKLNPALIITAKGIVAGKYKIPWTHADLSRKGNQIIIREMKTRRFKTVKKFKVKDVDNVPGLLDLVDSLLRVYQPERFDIKTQI